MNLLESNTQKFCNPDAAAAASHSVTFFSKLKKYFDASRKTSLFLKITFKIVDQSTLVQINVHLTRCCPVRVFLKILLYTPSI